MKPTRSASKMGYDLIRAVDETVRRRRMTKEEFRAAVMRERGMKV